MKTILSIRVCIVLILLVGCVDNENRAEEESPPAFPVSSDEAMVADNCDADDNFDFMEIERFELGAASGTWFANNDICEKCSQYAERRDALIAQAEMDTDNDGSQENEELELAKLQLSVCKKNCDISQFPNIFDKPLPATKIEPSPRCGESEYGLNLVTAPLIGWGANVGNPFASPIDVSTYEGISFWARRSSNSRGVVRVELADRYTGVTIDDKEPYCNPTTTQDTLFEGCDAYGTFATVGPKWSFFTLPFAQMRQAGWGKKAPGLELNAIRNLTFLFPTGQWDIWIDDVAFYKKAEFK